MKTMRKVTFRFILFMTAATLASNSSAQIAQDHPELCGRPGASIPVPEGVRWMPPRTAYSGDSTLFVKNADGERAIDLEVWPSVEQICPLPGDQLVLFGEPGDGNYSITRVDGRKGTIIDAIGGRNPVMSPDQHWLIMRAYHHFRSDLSDSEEYLLYDLTVDGSSNRMPGLTPFTQELVGRPVYPVPDDGAPFEFAGQPPETTHAFRSSTFFWAQDSSAVAFADSVQGKISIVVIRVDSKPPSALSYPVDVSSICEVQPSDNPQNPPFVTMTGIDFGSSRAITAHFTSEGACTPRQISINLDAFHAPIPEVHRPRERKPSTADGAIRQR